MVDSMRLIINGITFTTHFPPMLVSVIIRAFKHSREEEGEGEEDEEQEVEEEEREE